HQQQGQHQRRQGEQHFDHPAQNAVEPSGPQCRTEPEQQRQSHPDGGGGPRDPQRPAGAVHHAGEHVAAGGVGAEEFSEPRWGERSLGCDIGGACGGEQFGPQAGQDQHQHDQQAHQPAGSQSAHQPTTCASGASATTWMRCRSRGSTIRSNRSETDITATYPRATTSTTPITTGTSREWVASISSRPSPGRAKRVSTTTAPESSEPKAQPLSAIAGRAACRSECRHSTDASPAPRMRAAVANGAACASSRPSRITWPRNPATGTASVI